MPDVFELEVSPVGPYDGTDTGWLGEDSIDFGPPVREWEWQLPNWLDPLLDRVPTKLILVALVLGLAVAAGISATRPNDPVATAAPVVAPTPSAPLTAHQLTLDAMVAVAESPTPLANYAIDDDDHVACPSAAGAAPDPTALIASTVTRYQPSYHLLDASLGTQLSGICTAQLRLRGELGNIMVVTITAPPNSLTPFTVTSSNDRTDVIDVVVNVESWRIEIGLVGQPGTLLDEYDLVAIATDARLRWQAG